MRKPILLLALVTLLVGNAASIYFGSFPYQQSTDVEAGSATFKIGMVNLGDEPLKVNLTAVGLEEASLNTSGYTVPPSEVTRTPEGSGWIRIDGDRYAKFSNYFFQVVPDKESRRKGFNFTLRMEAYVSGTTDSGRQSTQRLVQVRENRYEYYRRTLPELEEEPKSEEDDGLEIITGSDDEEEDRDVNYNLSETVDVKPSNQTRVDNTTSTSGEARTRDSGPFNNTTAILLLGILASVYYVWRSVF